MGNLFFVFTPLQLFVAQQIIRQEELKDCILVESFVKDNRHFLEVYDMMLIKGLWKKKMQTFQLRYI